MLVTLLAMLAMLILMALLMLMTMLTSMTMQRQCGAPSSWRTRAASG
jgi:hypothetical protein